MDILFVILLYWVSLDMKHEHDPQAYIGFVLNILYITNVSTEN